MGVDEERRAVRVSRLEIARKVDLADLFEREGLEIFGCVESVIDRADVHIVDVEEQTATGAVGKTRRNSTSLISLDVNCT